MTDYLGRRYITAAGADALTVQRNYLIRFFRLFQRSSMMTGLTAGLFTAPAAQAPWSVTAVFYVPLTCGRLMTVAAVLHKLIFKNPDAILQSPLILFKQADSLAQRFNKDDNGINTLRVNRSNLISVGKIIHHKRNFPNFAIFAHLYKNAFGEQILNSGFNKKVLAFA
jgi:hypothetical protein